MTRDFKCDCCDSVVVAYKEVWKVVSVDYIDCYGAVVVGPTGTWVDPWIEKSRTGVFVYKDEVLVITEELEGHSDQKKVRQRILSPDHQWYWVKAKNISGLRLPSWLKSRYGCT